MKQAATMQIDTTIALSSFVASLPTFVAVLLTWMHSNSRMSDLQNTLNRCIDNTRDLLGAEFRSDDEDK